MSVKMRGTINNTPYANAVWLWSIGEKAENYSKYFDDKAHPDILWIFGSWDRQYIRDMRRLPSFRQSTS